MSKKLPEFSEIRKICEFCNNKSRYYDFPLRGVITCNCEAPKQIHDECLFNKIDYTKEYYYHKKIDLPCEICKSKLLLNGTFYTYHKENGLLSSERNYKNSVLHGPYKEYAWDGETLIKDMTYNEGKIEGLYKTWNSKRDGSYYLEIEDNYSNGLFNGLSTTYDSTGNIITKLLYKDNEVIEEIK